MIQPVMDFAAKTVAWRSTNSVKPGKELVWFENGGARGSLLFYDDEFADLQRPYQLTYRYLWDDQFVLNQATIEVSFDGETRSLFLSRKNAWQTADGEIVAPANCVDIDLWPSPLTTTLTLRRLGLKVGERKEIAVVYIEAPTLQIRRDFQVYTRIEKDCFYFESPNSSFRSIISVDQDLLVTDYPGLFRREA